MGVILGGLHLGRRSWETGRLYEGVGEVEEAARAIGDQLARTYPVQISQQGARAMVAFEGRPNGCRLVALNEGGAQFGGLILTEIADEGGAIGLWSRVFRNSEWQLGGRGGAPGVTALNGAAYFRLSYFGELERGKPLAWTDNWVERDSLPLLIRVSLGANRYGKVIDASFVVAVRQSCVASFYKCPDNVAR